VYRTIKEYIRAGLAGCHIEDVEYPKGVTTKDQQAARVIHENARIVPLDEAVGRIKGALKARDELQSSFVVIARTDARNAIGGGIDEAIRRANEFANVGADVLMFDGFQTWDECKTAIDRVKLPCFFTGTFFSNRRLPDGRWEPMPTVEQRAKDGEKIYLAVGLGMQPADQAHWETLVEFKLRGTEALEEWRDAQEAKRQDQQLNTFDVVGRERLWALQESLLPRG
jgi:2-methylisocitrate lyase-like PEP mutase family enzyme